jgi:hypothetical protein
MSSLSKTLRFVAVVLLSLSGYAHANFHSWRIDQIYSNQDGTIQYVVVVALASGQQFISGHAITVSQGSTKHAMTFTKNLPSDTGMMTGCGYYGCSGTSLKSMLLATQGFANLGIVTPDFIIPDGFLFTTGGGSIDWGGGYDTFNYTSIPMDGTKALFRAGNTAFNAPQNFNGDMGDVSPTYQGLWWNGTAENGWGINLTQQGNVMFATWFTYDTDGTPLWVVMTDGELAGTNSYSGTLYTTSGPRFDQYDTTKFAITPVGTGTFTFSDGANGTFNYTLKGVTQTKTITRQVYGSASALCLESGTPGTNYQDLWWHGSSENGWGMNLIQQSNVIFATWFTYDTTGKGMWVVMSDGVQSAANTWSGALYTTSGPRFDAYDASKFAITQVGTGTLTFTDPSNGTFTYTLKGVTQTKSITRQLFSSPSSVCR